MAVTIGRNIAALGVTRSLDRSSSSISRTFERLSSGLRINRASDDAAGLAVSSNLNHRARVLARAGLNVSDAIAMINIADAAMGQVSDLLTRMSELAYQAANGTYSGNQRKTMELEFLSLDREIRRIGSTTMFNGLNLLSGRYSNREATTVDLGNSGFAVGDSGRTSADGRYYLVQDGNNGNLIRVDTTSGAQTVIADGGLYSVSTAKVLNNGDVVFNDSSFGEIFYWSSETGEMRNLTANSGGSSFINNFTISDDGSTIAFVSGANFVNGGNLNQRGGAHPGYQVWTMNLQEGSLRLIQNSQSAVALGTTLSLSADGSYVLASDATLQRVWVANTTGPATTVRQVTTPTGSLMGVSNSGIAYFRSTSNLTGANPSGFSQIYSINHASGATAQLTNFTSNALSGGRLSSDGSTIYTFSTLDLANDGNTGGIRQLFAFNTENPGFQRLTDYTTSITAGIVSGDGGRVFVLPGGGGNLSIYDTTPEGMYLDFELGYGSAGNIADTISALSRSIRGLGAYGLSSQLAARSALDRMTANLGLLNEARGSIGALMSRLSSATNIIHSLRDEFMAASGRIRDADIAEETANLTKQQILQQVGAAVLAQAKTAPQLAIKLLQL